MIKKGLNDQEIIPIVRHFKNSPHTVRFIEYMDTGNTNQWQPDQVFSATQIVQEIDAIFPLKPLSTRLAGQTARFWAYQDGQGGIETIASITQPFCHDCTRARLFYRWQNCILVYLPAQAMIFEVYCAQTHLATLK